MDFSQIQLIYRAEGNANLVLVLPQHKKVLRLPKATLDSLKNEQNVEPKDHMAYMELMTHLLGEEYAYKPDIVSISCTERDTLNRFSVSYRPAERLDKEFCGQFGLLLPDATRLPDDLALKGAPGDTYSIEIKPKQGWMLQDTQIPDLFDLRGIEKCRYCCMQYLKLKSNKIAKLSSYCPMDIFSGDITRMKKAVKALRENPQNNFRMFKNGILVYGDFVNSYESLDNIFLDQNHSTLSDMVIKCLLRNYCDSSHNHPDLYSESTLSETLPAGCILRKILELQLLAKKNLKIMKYDTYHSTKTYSFLKNLLNKNIFSMNDLTTEEQYMIGATAMDCSIMITFQEADSKYISELANSPYLVTISGKSYITKVTALDLDPKSDNHFMKFVKQTNEAYESAEIYVDS